MESPSARGTRVMIHLVQAVEYFTSVYFCAAMQVINVIMKRGASQGTRGFLFRFGWNIISINPLVYNKCKLFF